MSFHKLREAQKDLAKLVELIELRMPAAQKLYDAGDSQELLYITSMLWRCAAIDQVLGDLLVIEVGEPSFGLGVAKQGVDHDADG